MEATLVRDFMQNQKAFATLSVDEQHAIEILARRIDEGAISDSTSQLDISPEQLVIEQEMKRMWERLDRQVRSVPEAKKRLKAAQAKFQKDFKSYPSHAVSWYLADVIRAEAEVSLASELRPTDKTPLHGEKGVKARAEHFCQQFLSGLQHTQSASSRSTSVMSNFTDDVKNEVYTRMYAELTAILNKTYLS